MKKKIEDIEYESIRYRKICNRKEYEELKNDIVSTISHDYENEYYKIQNLIIEKEMEKERSISIHIPYVLIFPSILVAVLIGELSLGLPCKILVGSLLVLFSICMFIRVSNNCLNYYSETLAFYRWIENILKNLIERENVKKKYKVSVRQGVCEKIITVEKSETEELYVKY